MSRNSIGLRIILLILVVWVVIYLSAQIQRTHNTYFKQQTNYKDFESNKSFYKILVQNYNQDKPISFIQPEFKSEISNLTIQIIQNSTVTKDHIKKVLILLQKNNAVLLDVDSFENLTLKARNKLDKYYSDKQDLHLAFGVSIDNFETLNQALEKELLGIFELSYVTQNYRKNRILTSVYIHAKNIHLQISILYKRGDFIWIGKDSYVHASKKFGDKPRAINNFKTVKITDEDSNVFNIPSNLKKFLYDYAHSTFEECNAEMALTISQSQKQNKDKNERFIKQMRYVTEKLESLNLHYWLSCGSLLGWYRECGIIPFTHDIDFNVWAHEHDISFANFFKGNKNLWLQMILGYPENNYEFRLKANDFTIDIFYTYKIPNNNTSQWNTFQLSKSVWRQYLPKINELCSAELLNSKFLVPCNPVEHLNADYGAHGWQTPKKSSNLHKETKESYTWPSLHFFNKSSDAEFLKSVKWYNIDGSLDNKTTFNFLNNGLDKKISMDEFNKLNIT